MKKKIKVFHSYGGHDYSNFIVNKEIVKTVEEADLVFLRGGADVQPHIYGEPKNPRTFCEPAHDKADLEAFEKATALGLPIIGICKGSQMCCALAGGKLVQHMEHPSYHEVLLPGNEKGFLVTSSHHQMQYPYNLPEDQYEVLAYTKNMSHVHLGGNFEEMKNPEGHEVEAAFYPKIKALAIQCHPEWLWDNKEKHTKLFTWIFKQFKDKLGLDIESPLTK